MYLIQDHYSGACNKPNGLVFSECTLCTFCFTHAVYNVLTLYLHLNRRIILHNFFYVSLPKIRSERTNFGITVESVL